MNLVLKTYTHTVLASFGMGVTKIIDNNHLEEKKVCFGLMVSEVRYLDS